MPGLVVVGDERRAQQRPGSCRDAIGAGKEPDLVAVGGDPPRRTSWGQRASASVARASISAAALVGQTIRRSRASTAAFGRGPSAANAEGAAAGSDSMRPSAMKPS